jgi:hypothetical protein
VGYKVYYGKIKKMVIPPKFTPWWIMWIQNCPWFTCAPGLKLHSQIFSLGFFLGLCNLTWLGAWLRVHSNPILELLCLLSYRKAKDCFFALHSTINLKINKVFYRLCNLTNLKVHYKWNGKVE